MLVGLAWLYILTKWKPYKDHESSWVGEVLALQMLLNLLLMLALTAWRKSEELVTGTEYYNRVAFNFFLIGTNAVCTIIAILVVLVSLPHASEVWKKLKKKGASFCNMLRLPALPLLPRTRVCVCVCGAVCVKALVWRCALYRISAW